jgi:hypothetical protein
MNTLTPAHSHIVPTPHLFEVSHAMNVNNFHIKSVFACFFSFSRFHLIKWRKSVIFFWVVYEKFSNKFPLNFNLKYVSGVYGIYANNLSMIQKRNENFIFIHQIVCFKFFNVSKNLSLSLSISLNIICCNFATVVSSSK